LAIRLTKRVAIVAGMLATSCASSPSSSVPLHIPEPPPRVAIDPVPAVIAGTPVTPDRPTGAPVSRPGTAPPTTATATNPPAAAPVPPTPAVVPEGPLRPTPPPELRAAGSTGRKPTASEVKDRLVRTKQKLDTINARSLNAGKRTDFNSARRFLAQAEEAVRENNLLLAESSVEKAETLADGLR
jgi:hypothetical protein